MISLDTETTGLDLRHGARPYFVTICDGEGQQLYWEWDVNPFTREPVIPDGDVEVIQSLIDVSGELVLQNAKFDKTVWEVLVGKISWPWEKTHDTLIASHVLHSSMSHDLTSLALHYLGRDIEPLEKALQKCCEEARRWCRVHLKDWKIAKQGLEGMPSAKEKCWKFDGWLPRALALERGLSPTHPYWEVLAEYANGDSAVTRALWPVLEEELVERDLWEIYLERMKAVRIAPVIERVGITASEERLVSLREEYVLESENAERTCVSIACKYDYPLELPRGANNKSLTRFCFGEPDESLPGSLKWDKPLRTWLDLPIVGWTDTGNPALNKEAMEDYESMDQQLTQDQKEFIAALAAKRARDTAVNYMDSYRRFWLPWVPAWDGAVNGSGEGWYVLHPSLNPTGTNTLRWSSSNPNEQNISKRKGFNLRYIFGPAPGREWWSMDAENIELRIPTYEAEEEEAIALFERPNAPPYYGSYHLLNFSTVYADVWGREIGKRCDDPNCCNGAVVDLTRVGPHCKKQFAATYYQWCKNGDFAVQYGAVDRDDGEGTADRAFHRPGAQRLLKARFKKLEALNQRWIRYAEKHGYVETIPDRTVNPRRGYPVMCSRTDYGRIKPTVPLNYHVQSTAMWWTMKAMIRCQEQLDEWNREAEGRGQPLESHGYFIVMQVHDEIVFDVPRRAHPKQDPKKSNLSRAKVLQGLMRRGGDDIGIPTPVGLTYHPDNWSVGISL